MMTPIETYVVTYKIYDRNTRAKEHFQSLRTLFTSYDFFQ